MSRSLGDTTGSRQSQSSSSALSSIGDGWLATDGEEVWPVNEMKNKDHMEGFDHTERTSGPECETNSQDSDIYPSGNPSLR